MRLGDLKLGSSWKSALVWAVVVLALTAGAWFAWRNHQATTATVEQLREDIREVHLEAARQIEDLEQDVKAASREARKAGDRRVKAIVSGSDADFLDALNEYSASMVERVERGLAED